MEQETARHLAKVIGETFREIGILVLVFGMLDKIIHEGGPPPGWTAKICAIALPSIVLGCILEARNHDR